MEYDVIHLSEYNPKTDMYEREEHSQFHAACNEVACCIFGKVVMGNFNTSMFVRAEGPKGRRLCGFEVKVNRRIEYYGLYYPINKEN